MATNYFGATDDILGGGRPRRQIAAFNPYQRPVPPPPPQPGATPTLQGGYGSTPYVQPPVRPPTSLPEIAAGYRDWLPARPPASPPPSGGMQQLPGGVRDIPAQPPAPDPQRDLSNKLLEQLMSFMSDPSRYGQAFTQQFEAGKGRLRDQFALDRADIEADAARRGLTYSTVPMTAFGNLADRQARAEADLMAQIEMDRARTQSQDMATALNAVMGYGQNQFSNQLATSQLNMLQDQQLRDFLLQLLQVGG